MTFAVVFALAAAFSNAVNLMTQHSASVGAPAREKGWRLALYLVRQPLWLLGGAAAVGSYAFQALALHNGPMSVVQPVLVTELVFVLVLRRVWIRQDVARAAWAAVTVVCVALAVFLAVAEPTGGQPAPGGGGVAVRRAGVRRDHRRAGRGRQAGLAGAPGRRPRGGRSAHLGPGGNVPQDGDRHARRVRDWRHAHQLAACTRSSPLPSPARCSSRPLCTSGR